MNKLDGYIVTWKGFPTFWSERWSKFYNGAGFKNPVTVMTNRRLAQRRIVRSVAAWGHDDKKDYLIRRVRWEVLK